MSTRVLRPFLPLLWTGLPRALTGAAKRGSGRLRAVSSWADFVVRSQKTPHTWSYVVGVVAAASGLGLATYMHQLRAEKVGNGVSLLLPELQAAGGKEEEAKMPKVSVRELRYKEFASIVYKGEPYMSGRDFLESVAQDEPRAYDPVVMDDKLLNKMLKTTPSRSKGSSHLFRDMWNDGILSYGDYLFLLTALVKTTRQFEIAFKMIDVDGSDFIDLNEFSRVEEAVTRQRDKPLIEQQKLKHSSLTLHLFGQKGNQRLYSKDFIKFIEDLQTEVREIEFNKYSGGAPTISEQDFARILLHHTSWDMDPVFARLKKVPPSNKEGLTFPQFNDFCHLLNSLDDFSIAMMMFTIAGTSVTQEEFARAAKVCIGTPLDASMVNTVFHIFDVDGDGKLSYREFLAVMKRWKLRGYKAISRSTFFTAYLTFEPCKEKWEKAWYNSYIIKPQDEGAKAAGSVGRIQDLCQDRNEKITSY